ncbi:MAG: hypothetical protein A2W69_01485 [Gammaproteobacteria bacterium RIFCSPLOWO2_02_47_7]|nr:MAG: hypothetical protein A2W69_01485 [Gammaproteobacteria bacterium RIFCSPLOWO2_02_47_7]OGT72928.1 MAG: hypothetical protein A2W76_02560 [Gammaproteobacteria bacterium RIFCSPLOWO2_12_47_11]
MLLVFYIACLTGRFVFHSIDIYDPIFDPDQEMFGLSLNLNVIRSSMAVKFTICILIFLCFNVIYKHISDNNRNHCIR